MSKQDHEKVSARPAKLRQYAKFERTEEERMKQQAIHLQAVLRTFEDSCTEIRMAGSQSREVLITRLNHLVYQHLDLQAFTSTVAQAFETADGQAWLANILISTGPIEFRKKDIFKMLYEDQRVLFKEKLFKRKFEILMNIGEFKDTQIYSFDTVYGTLVLNERNYTMIKNTAEKYNIPPDILLGVVASEMDFDHDWKDKLQDHFGRNNIPLRQGQGVASVHSDTLDACIEYLKGQKLPVAEYAEDYDRSVDNLASFEGSVEGAAIVTAALYHYKGGASTLEDKAVIWGGYRSGVKGLTPPGDEGYGYTSQEEFKNNRANGAGERNDGLEIGRNAYMSQPYFELFDRVIKIDERIDGRTGPVDHLNPPYA